MLYHNVHLLTVLPVPFLTDIMSLKKLEKGKDVSHKYDNRRQLYHKRESRKRIFLFNVQNERRVPVVVAVTLK